ncbi:FAD dependent oxidoreductase [Bacteriovorax sp. BSW11_IV]|uniref:glycerol-3-phosphate dehydrogenase/oxidase n=1 Tax=Bacteriovorax sp. BSW11_IV TaxID=1353529 RepID=UPI00038A1291|nr:FAD-dependent oxidoreductase [Bacteriovorax sp. BSW11_IV]EQC48421.1 FAD dependent oxidoreductase [Bacteriovorax sp. BSW11_IV]
MSKLESIPLSYNTLIIGGGIVGAGIFRDLSLQGLNCLVVDKKDFSSQTSQSSSKMLHGGIRYLENMDFGLVFEALHEKNLWLKIAPHLCYEMNFYMPVFKDSLRPKWMLKIGLFLYDLLSGFQNSPHKMVSKSDTMKFIPGIKESGLKGSGMYYDAIVDDLKLTLEVIYDGLKNKNCHALNYVEYVKHETLCDNQIKVTLKDNITGISRDVFCQDLVFATGPFTDHVLKDEYELKWKDHILPSKGSHIWIKKERLPLKSAMVLTPNDGRVIFVIPQKDHVLVGTTEVNANEDFFDIKASQNELEYLIANLNNYFPHSKFTLEDIVNSFAGIRPLVKEDSDSNLGKTAREHKYFQVKPNLHIIIGGKYTTFRVMASDVAKAICLRQQRNYNDGLSSMPLRQKSIVDSFKEIHINDEIIKSIVEKEHVRKIEDVSRRINRPEFTLSDSQKKLIETLLSN